MESRTCCDTDINQEHSPDCDNYLPRPGEEATFGMPVMSGMSELIPGSLRPDHVFEIRSSQGILVRLTLSESQVDMDFGGEGYGRDLSPQAVRVTRIIIAALEKFWQKNDGYGDTAYALGARGQYADMNRKMGKLKHTLWDGSPAVGESMVEMLQDLIGHAGLTIDFLERDEK